MREVGALVGEIGVALTVAHAPVPAEVTAATRTKVFVPSVKPEIERGIEFV